ncbi:hypothetical protein HDU96_007385 [Phlyctochytrium bullatum]|nr:hypothetical protein HDU96_007385 [Phlyctochytrium bullatum]
MIVFCKNLLSFLGSSYKKLQDAIFECINECSTFAGVCVSLAEEQERNQKAGVKLRTGNNFQARAPGSFTHRDSKDAFVNSTEAIAFEMRFPLIFQRFQTKKRALADILRLIAGAGTPERE